MPQFHNNRLNLRLPEDISAALNHLVNDKSEKYDNASHAMRVAVIRLLRSEGYYKPKAIKSHEGQTHKNEIVIEDEPDN